MSDAVNNQTEQSPRRNSPEKIPPGSAPANHPRLPAGVSVVIPVYNSATILPELVPRLRAVLAGAGVSFEVVLVNDGSRDQSWQVIEELVFKHSDVHGINLMRNYGQHNALLRGIRSVRYDVTVTVDDDMQHPPEEIPTLLTKLAEGYDVVYGTPMREQHGIWRDLASQITKLALQSAMGVATAREASAFRAFRTDLRRAFANYDSPYVVIDVLLAWGTTLFGSVPVRHAPRQKDVTGYSFRKLVAHAINMFTGFSVLPLRVASLIGFFCAFFGAFLLFYVVGRFLLQGSVPGFPLLASAISIFSGAQLLALGVIGEYLAGIHFRSMGRPYTVVRVTAGFNSDSQENQR
jgi:glycosyltransferase involved in cell wall biosynthesis